MVQTAELKTEEQKNVGCGLVTRHIRKGAQGLRFEGLCAIRIGSREKAMDAGKMLIAPASSEDPETPDNSGIRSCIFPGSGGGGSDGGNGRSFLKGYKLFRYRIEVDFEDAFVMDIQNKLYLFYEGKKVCDVNYDFFNRRSGKFRNSRLVKRDGRTMFFRQTVNNKTWFTVRPQIPYDRPSQMLKLKFAWLLSKAMGASDTILMYEKEASRYEESASVLFEKLVEQGYANVKYIIDEGNPAIDRMPSSCRDHLIYKNSFSHLLEFFRDYIDGVKEIAEVNAEFNARYISEIPDEDSGMSCGMGMRR